MSSLSIPTTTALPASQLLPSAHPSVLKTLQRLSRPSLLSLALDWLDERNQGNTAPYLAQENEDDEQDLYPPEHSLSALRELYTELQLRKGSKRDVLDRILEGDWRDGISLYQLAMADMQYLYDHPSSQKWSPLKIVRLESGDAETSTTSVVPRFHPATFLRNLQRESLPDVKAHYNLDRHASLPLTILRIFIIDSPYNTSLALHSSGKQRTTFDSSRTFYVAFPDASPFIYVSLSNATSLTTGSSISDNRSLRKLVLDGIPKAFSRPRERYTLQGTTLSARNLEALVEKRGGGRSNAAGGGWGVYAEENKMDTPLNLHLPTPESMIGDEIEKTEKVTGMKRNREDDEQVAKRRKLVANGRFGNSAKHEDGKGIERLEIYMTDPFPSTAADHDFEDPPQAVDDVDDVDITMKKPRGRRSTISLELNRDNDEDEVGADAWKPNIRVLFQGKHIFAGIRQLVEEGVIDGEKMPGWMTGEDGVSFGIVQNGRIKGHKGNGI